MNIKKFRNPFARVGLERELDYFVENVSMLVAAGMPVASAFHSVGKETRSRRMRRMIEGMETDIEAGEPLWKALERSQLFKEHIVSLVRIGEETGRLVENLKVIAIEERKDRAFRSRVRSAILYPAFVLLVMIVVGIGIAWFILPKLALVFSQLRIDLPFVTRLLIGAGTFLGAHGNIVVPAAVSALFFVFFFLFVFPKTKMLGQYCLFFLPGVKNIIREVETARFGFLLGMLLEAGLPVVRAIDSLSSATGNAPYRRFYRHLCDSIEEGNSFEKSFLSARRGYRFIETPIQQLIVAGERSGNLPETLKRIGETFEAKAESTTKNLTVMLEPVLLVIVWLGVVAVALAVILPIYSLVGGLNQDNQNQSAPVSAPTVSEEIPVTEKSEEFEPTVPKEEALKESSAPESLSEEIKEAGEALPMTRLRIMESEIGYLNVRETPSKSGAIVGKVFYRDEFDSPREENGWFLIPLPDGKTGWISGEYAEKIERL